MCWTRSTHEEGLRSSLDIKNILEELLIPARFLSPGERCSSSVTLEFEEFVLEPGAIHIPGKERK